MGVFPGPPWLALGSRLFCAFCCVGLSGRQELYIPSQVLRSWQARIDQQRFYAFAVWKESG